MNLFANALCILAVASFVSSAGLPLIGTNKLDFLMGEQEVLTLEQKLQTMGIDASSIHPSILEDAKLDVPDLIRKYGYGIEVHHVTTRDGYILEMHRITSSPREPTNVNATAKQPVFLMHGLLGASSGWVVMGPYHGLGYLLSDLGYDVWMGNARGNIYSRKHVSLNPDSVVRSERRDFWDFSWHEIGVIDLPFMIDYVLEYTRFKRLHYIGHSQGTTSFFVMTSELPAYNDKIIAMQALAPVAFMSNLYSPLVRILSQYLEPLNTLTNLLGIYEWPMLEGSDADNGLCNDDSFVQALCGNSLFLVAGSNPDQLNATMLPVIAGHTPAGASTNNLVHYGQLLNNGLFRQYDHGILGNRLRYGTITPPNYNLDNISVAVALHYSSNDWLAHVDDVVELHKALPNSRLFLVPDSQFTHLDFLIAMDVHELLHNRMIDIMRKFESRQ